jgi:hypothetical protein
MTLARVGIKGQSYLNLGTHAAPTWKRASVLHDLTLAVSKGEVQVKNKGSRWVKYLSALNDAPLDVEVDWSPGDDVFDALQDAFWTDEVLEFVILDGGIKKAGAQGLLAGFTVTKFECVQPLEDQMIANASLRLAADWEHEPAWVTAAATGVLTVVGEFGDDPDNEPPAAGGGGD